MNDVQFNRRKRAFTWIISTLAILYALFHFGFIIWHAFHNTEWMIQEIVVKHYSVIIVLPSAGFAIAGLLLLFYVHSDSEMSVKIAGFEFKGVACPLILWVICFLACATAIKMLW